MKNKVRSLRPARRRRVDAPAAAAATARPAAMIEAIEPRLLFAIFEVTSVADAGPGTLRQAILDANGAAGEDEIVFNVAAASNGTVQTIALQSPLPEVNDIVTIDATQNPGYEVNNKPVIEINGAGAGATANGLVLNTTDDEAASNVLGLIINRFGGNGIVIRGDWNLVIDTYIGTNGAGTGAGPGNGGHGILIEGGDNSFIAENIIAHNALDGVAVVNAGANVAMGNDVTLNSFFANGGLPVDLGNDGPTANDAVPDPDTGPNGLQNFPELDEPVARTGGGLTITGRVRTSPNTLVSVTLYTSPGSLAMGDVEGTTVVGSVDVTTLENGIAEFTWDATGANVTDWVTATANNVLVNDLAFEVNSSEFSAPVRIETDPPLTRTVTQVFVNGPALTGANPTAGQLAFRQAAGVDSVFGYTVPGGADQTRPLSWVGGITSVSIRFDQDVQSDLAQGDLVVTGSAGPVSTTAFTYDPATRTGTWTLAAVTRDRLRFVIDDANLPNLDGEWTNPTEAFPGVGGDAYPSGNGTAGGDFNFRVNVLHGDATGDGNVNALDVAFVKARLTRRPGEANYSIFADNNGDGVINALDLAAVKGRLTQRIDNAPVPATALLFA